jgi:predicted outer membrane repeat protein
VECDGVEFGFSNNGNKATAGSGGAIYLSGSRLTADNCTFRNNQAQAGDGGAIAAYTSTVTIDTDYPLSSASVTTDRLTPGAPQATTCDPKLKRCSSLYSNTATNSTAANGNGGAIFASDSNLKVNKTILNDNLAQRGGAIYQAGVSATGAISNTLVYSNTSLQPFGAGMRVAGGVMTLRHATLANNTGGAGYSPGSVQSYIYNSIFWGNSTVSFNPLTAAVCNIDQGGTAGPAANPLFMSPGGGEDYRLRLGSPALDACSSGLPFDLLNIPRPAGSQYDMGAYELVITHLYLPVVLQ